MAGKPTIPDFPTLPDFGKMITQACEVVASVRGIPYDFNGTLSLENKFVVLFKTVKEMFHAQDALVKSYKELYEFINAYFDNLDVQEEINNSLDKMAREGTLLTIIKPTISNETTKWLDNNMTNPTSPAVDKSLSVQGAAADAFMTGSLLSSLFSPNYNYFRENLGEGTTFTDGHYIDANGAIHVNKDYSYSDYIAVPSRTALQIKSGIDTFVCVYNEKKEKISGAIACEKKIIWQPNICRLFLLRAWRKKQRRVLFLLARPRFIL